MIPLTPFLSDPAAPEPKASSCAAGAQADALAWRREMERAQSDHWFKPWDERRLQAGPGHATGAAPVRAQAVDAPANAMPSGQRGRVDGAAALAVMPPTTAGRSASASSTRPVPGEALPASAYLASGTVAQTPRAAGAGPAGAERAASGLLPARSSPWQPLSALLSPSAGPLRLLDLLSSVAPGNDVNAAPDSDPARPGRVAEAVARALAPHAPVRLHVQWHGDTARVWLGVDGGAERLAEMVPALSRWLAGIGMRLRSLVCNGHTLFDRDASAAAASQSDRERDTAAAASPAGHLTFIDIVAERES